MQIILLVPFVGKWSPCEFRRKEYCDMGHLVRRYNKTTWNKATIWQIISLLAKKNVQKMAGLFTPTLISNKNIIGNHKMCMVP